MRVCKKLFSTMRELDRSEARGWASIPFDTPTCQKSTIVQLTIIRLAIIQLTVEQGEID
jgi:hypothetical protein